MHQNTTLVITLYGTVVATTVATITTTFQNYHHLT